MLPYREVFDEVDDWLEGIRLGEPWAWRRASDYVHDLVNRYLRPTGNLSPFDVDDVAQEVLIKLARLLPRDDTAMREGNSKQFIAMTVRNVIVDFRRRATRLDKQRRESPLPELPVDSDDPAMAAERHEQVRIVDEIISALNEDLRRVILLHLDGCTIDEIASSLSISRTTVTKRLCDALSEIWQQLGTDPDFDAYVWH